MHQRIIKTVKRDLTKWEKIFANCISNEGLISRIPKEFLQFNDTNQIQEWAKDLNRLSKEDIQVANNCLKKCSTSLVIMKIQINTTVRYDVTPIRMAIMRKKNGKIINIGENMRN